MTSCTNEKPRYFGTKTCHIFFEHQYRHKRSYTHAYTHPYERTHAHPTPMSTSERLSRHTPSFPVYMAYLKILVFPFYKSQFGCSPSHVQISRCNKSLHASIKRKLTNACTLCMHALQLMHS